ncbi:chromosome segregation protein SMC [filamentous cyanobacterium LEGE 11480]|uniref:Chromosome partition protein Smc n=1 Tax=Romeriopsis navalis LEGE 11480 TaxID=2777977 RepID=A0A928VS46_9CYAN|nr:chromosome segregation protein SMC [Romeriopsis navalis]MBE9031555.1 chromosome segregation protein SMC [Romeriopsis navalis LEGE 11480]
MYVKRIQLTNFKSFGGTTAVPILPGFTVISGPNGSGKSNLLDAILFCLGLAGSRGMRAERLPDLVNQGQASRHRTVEAAVTVTLDLSDDPDLWEIVKSDANPDVASVEVEIAGADSEATRTIELSEPEAPQTNGRLPDFVEGQPTEPAREWSVTRKLRVTKQGTYTSNYYINGQPTTLTDLHDKLNQLRVYPEGYNVVLQGDVTRIISMNARERREIIDELAGVSSFDRRINQAKGKLDAVKDCEERERIVERELIEQRDRLSQDKIKAEKYKKLRAQLQTKEQWEGIIRYRQAVQALEKLQAKIISGEAESVKLGEKMAALDEQIKTASTELEALNAKVRALGEAEQIALQSQLATREAELRQLQRQEQDFQNSKKALEATLAKTQTEIQANTQLLEQLTTEQTRLETEELTARTAARQEAQNILESSRQAASESAANAEAWVQEQTQLRRQVDEILQTLDPQRTEQAQLRERTAQLDRQLEEQTKTRTTLTQQLESKKAEHATLAEQLEDATTTVQASAQGLSGFDSEIQIQKDTQTRLLHEQREKQRKLDKLEAQTQAVREAQGTHATQVIMKMGMDGVHGLVADLGQVEPRFQQALSVAAGGRLGQLVVEDDTIASAAIQILKQQRAGRATFLPLNKIRPPRIMDDNATRGLSGCVDLAINLVDFDDDYWDVFAYVLGSTLVFEQLNDARRYLGDYRMVTLDGELLEPSGAMTGGNVGRAALRFGKTTPSESSEVRELRERLAQIDTILLRCEDTLAKATIEHQNKTKQMIESRQNHREMQIKLDQLAKEIKQLEAQLASVTTNFEQQTQELNTSRARLELLETDLPRLETQLTSLRATLSQLEESQTHSEWQTIQANLRRLEADVAEREKALRAVEQKVLELTNQRQRLEEKITEGHNHLTDVRAQQTALLQQQNTFGEQQAEIQTKITELKTALVELDKTLGEERTKRDTLDRQVRELQTSRQQLEWQQQKLAETQATRRQEVQTQQEAIQTQREDLPEEIPEEIPEDITQDVSQLQHEIRSLQRRLQAMEPVNMLALEEHDKVQERLQELTEKLQTLEEERTELLLRIENFATLRVRAFKEAYDAVDKNFQEIFATLSQGDGRLQLEDQQDPFNGGLTLIAHPKGKQVQRLASMSGGEKSLTALSFIFALQRYRPSPFYAFDEVDMFLDGANVERLSRMIKHQATLAQFIVVSLRRPMIESAQRTIGVTQARGAYTQVLGIKLDGQQEAQAPAS